MHIYICTIYILYIYILYIYILYIYILYIYTIYILYIYIILIYMGTWIPMDSWETLSSIPLADPLCRDPSDAQASWWSKAPKDPRWENSVCRGSSLPGQAEYPGARLHPWNHSMLWSKIWADGVWCVIGWLVRYDIMTQESSKGQTHRDRHTDRTGPPEEAF